MRSSKSTERDGCRRLIDVATWCVMFTEREEVQGVGRLRMWVGVQPQARVQRGGNSKEIVGTSFKPPGMSNVCY